MKKTVRFWHYATTPVLIKMRAGQTLSHTSGGPTDEGWHRDVDVWHFDGRTVFHNWCSDGVDCDGRLMQNGKCYFDAAEAFAGNECDGVRFPAWQQGEHSQRDFSAEAMGY